MQLRRDVMQPCTRLLSYSVLKLCFICGRIKEMVDKTFLASEAIYPICTVTHKLTSFHAGHRRRLFHPEAGAPPAQVPHRHRRRRPLGGNVRSQVPEPVRAGLGAPGDDLAHGEVAMTSSNTFGHNIWSLGHCVIIFGYLLSHRSGGASSRGGGSW